MVRRDGVVVAGPDAHSWLQGQLTQDLAGMEEGESRLSLVLTPQGKVSSFCRVTAVGGDRLLLDLEQGFGVALAERLARFKLRVKATLEEVGVTASCSDGGWDGLGAPELSAATVPADAGLEARIEARLEFERLCAMLPRLGRELTAATIPQEAGAALVERTISFTKGCYTGQELVARLDARGSNVPRRLRLLRGTGGEVAHAGDAVEVDGVEAGVITSYAPSPEPGGGFAALAYLKRSALAADGHEACIVGPSGERIAAVVEAERVGRG